MRNLMPFLGTSWKSPLARAALVQLLAPEAGEVDRRLLLHFLEVAAHGDQIVAFMRSMGEIDTSEQARRIAIPTLVLASDADRVMPIVESRRLASLIPGGRFEILRGIDHRGASGQDRRVMELVAEFLAEGTR